MTLASYIALTRFGLGPLGGEQLSDVGGWARGQLMGVGMSPALSALPGSPEMIALRKALVQARRKEVGDMDATRKQLRQLYIADISARITHGATTRHPFAERMVLFWSNHFCVSVSKAKVMGLGGAYEREAIRPHVMGRFVDMLKAVVMHPAMLWYLDNDGSVGPDSPMGRKRKQGLNENLAREILELHTLGVDGGYSQQDVTRFAKVLTGWGVAQGKNIFQFRPPLHEPGAQEIMGVRYDGKGMAQGVEVLEALARHPATAKHIATKLARHFIADAPPAGAVAALAESYMAHDGDLRRVYATLMELPEAWRAEPAKMRSSYDLLIGALRLCGVPEMKAAPKQRQAWGIQSLQFLGGMPFTAPSPAGFGDTLADWSGPEAMLRRVEWAQNAARVLPVPKEVTGLAEAAMGPIMQPATREAIAAAGSPRAQLALLLACPEFQRR